MTSRREIKNLNNMKIADELLAEETYTLADLLDPRTKYYMLNLTDKEREEFIKQKKIEVHYKNLIPCVILGKEKLNGINTYQYAERKGLTQNMSHEQKQMLEKISRDVSFWRILATTKKYLALITGIMTISNFIIYMKFPELYNIIQPEENYIFLSLFCIVIILYRADKNKCNKIIGQMYKLAQSQEK